MAKLSTKGLILFSLLFTVMPVICQLNIATSEIEQIAEDAYIYFYPAVQTIDTLFYGAIWQHSPRFDSPVNTFTHFSQLLDHTFTAVVSPNIDTFYSPAWLDLDEEPIVLSLPDVPSQRYYSIQIVDGYTFNIRIISPRVTRSWAADTYLITGPKHRGVTANFDEDHIIRSSSRFTFILGRTAIVRPLDDFDEISAVQNGYVLTPLRKYSGHTRMRSTPSSSLPVFPFINSDELDKNLPEPQLFFTYANFIMKYIRIEKHEFPLFRRFRKINISPGVDFDGQKMSTEEYQAIRNGMESALTRIQIAPFIEQFGNLANGWATFVDPPIFGTPEVLKGKYLVRAYAAFVGLFGNDAAEAYYPIAITDSDGDAFDSTSQNYTLTLQPDQYPPIIDHGFWSITMYRLPERLLVHNPIDRYTIGDRTGGLIYDENGTLTIYIQKDPPEGDKVANWLPAPAMGDPDYGNYESGFFNMVFRIYWPTEEALGGPYIPPAVEKAN